MQKHNQVLEVTKDIVISMINQSIILPINYSEREKTSQAYREEICKAFEEIYATVLKADHTLYTYEPSEGDEGDF